MRGGGGSTSETKATTITVIDGYIKGATVCVDSNDNGACDATETQGTTDENGKVTLNIPAADVGKYHIVAVVSADAIDMDTNTKVGKAFTLKAPKDDHSVVTPFTTLVVQKIQANSTWTTEQAKTQVASDTGVSVSVLTSDFTKAEDQAPRTFARTLVAIQKDRKNALNALTNCKSSQKEQDELIQTAVSNALSSIKISNSTTEACNTSAKQKNAACQTAIDNSVVGFVSGNVGLTTATLRNKLADTNCRAEQSMAKPVPSATITLVKEGDKVISSGGRTDSLAITLTGSYTAALGTDYSVQVLDGGTQVVGTVTKDDNANTWSLSLSSVTPGKHDYKAVVVRNSDSLQGTVSSAYTINVGNSVSASNSSPKAWDEFTLTLSNVWSNVKSVVFTFAANVTDMADNHATQIVNWVNNAWNSVTTAFKTAGQVKTITVKFFEGRL